MNRLKKQTLALSFLALTSLWTMAAVQATELEEAKAKRTRFKNEVVGEGKTFSEAFFKNKIKNFLMYNLDHDENWKVSNFDALCKLFSSIYNDKVPLNSEQKSGFIKILIAKKEVELKSPKPLEFFLSNLQRVRSQSVELASDSSRSDFLEKLKKPNKIKRLPDDPNTLEEAVINCINKHNPLESSSQSRWARVDQQETSAESPYVNLQVQLGGTALNFRRGSGDTSVSLVHMHKNLWNFLQGYPVTLKEILVPAHISSFQNNKKVFIVPNTTLKEYIDSLT